MKMFLSVLIGGMISFSAFSQESFTLDEAVQYALTSNISVRKAQLDIQDAEGQLLEYKATGIPKVNASVDYNYYPQVPQFLIPSDFIPGEDPGGFVLLPAGTAQNIIAKIDANILLFDASFFTGLKAQRMYRELVARQADIPEQDVKANVTKAYFAVLIALKNKEIIQKNIDNLQKTFEETKAIYESGFAEQLDVDRLDLSLSNLQVEADKLDRLIVVSYNLLKFQMGYPMNEELAVEDDLELLLGEFTAESVDLTGAPDFNARAEYQVLSLSEELSKIDIKRYKDAYWPVLSAFGSHQQQLQRDNLFDDDENNWFGTTVIGLGLKIPVFDGLDKKAKIQRAKVTLDRTLLEKVEFERAMTMEIRNAGTSYQNALENVENTQRSLDLAQRIYDTAGIKFREGVGSSVEVAQAERELYEAQSNYTNSLYDLLIARTDLNKALGK